MNKNLLIFIVLIGLIISFTTKKIIMKIRSDKRGNGRFGASRGNRTHEGVDITTEPNTKFEFPIELKFIRYAYPYKGITKIKGGLFMDKKGRVWKFFYLNPNIKADFTTSIGTSQDIAGYYAKEKNQDGMINHVHAEVRDKNGILLNPEKILNVS